MITILSSVQALRRLGDHRQQIDQMFHVHLAAVVGKGIEAALHAEREQDAPVQIRPFSMQLAKIPCLAPEKRMFTASWV